MYTKLGRIKTTMRYQCSIGEFDKINLTPYLEKVTFLISTWLLWFEFLTATLDSFLIFVDIEKVSTSGIPLWDSF